MNSFPTSAQKKEYEMRKAALPSLKIDIGMGTNCIFSADDPSGCLHCD
jgi:hypothetical protein